jgi:hypothetical protein
MWSRLPFMTASNLKRVSYAMRHVLKALAEAPQSRTIETYWNTTMQQYNIWSIAFEAHSKEIMIEVCCSNGPHWILHAQSGTRFAHKSTRLNPILINQQGTT